MARVARNAAGGLVLLVLSLALAGGATARTDGTIEPTPIDGDTCVSTTYVFFVYSDPGITCSTVDWSVDPAYDGPSYADNTEAAAAEPPPPTPPPVVLPTWRNLYDWPGGHGYVGWHSNASPSSGAYGIQSNLGGQYGLWLWPLGDQWYDQSEYAEWTYTAPGTTRLSSVRLSFAYRNKLLAHHCIDVGFRTLAGVVTSINTHCQPAQPPDSQRNVDVTLVDPASNPTSKVLFFRIRLACNGSQTTCSKHIPSLDPLTNGAMARLLKVDMTLVDDDLPSVTPSNALYDMRGTYASGKASYPLTIRASDAGAGVQTSSANRDGTGVISSSAAPCDPTHRTPELDNRICPATYTATTSVDGLPLPEGSNEFYATARDLASNQGASPAWEVVLDRTPPAVVSAVHVRRFDAASGVATIGWTAGDDPDLPNALPPSGVGSWEYRFARGGGTWSDWSTADVPSFDLPSASSGQVVNVEVREHDAVDNVAATTPASITVAPASEPDDDTFVDLPGPLDTDQTDPTGDDSGFAPPAAPVPVSPLGPVVPGSYAFSFVGADESGVDGGTQVAEQTSAGTSALSGVVTDLATGQPIGNADVTIVNDNGLGLRATSTADGAFAFTDLPAADTGYTVRVAATGFGGYVSQHEQYAQDTTYSENVALTPEPQTYDQSQAIGSQSGTGTTLRLLAETAPRIRYTQGYASRTQAPPSIRVAITDMTSTCDNPGGAGAPIHIRSINDWRWRFYVLRVTAGEAVLSSPRNSVLAVAAAVQNFAWYSAIYPHSFGGDYYAVVSSTNDQCFRWNVQVPTQWYHGRLNDFEKCMNPPPDGQSDPEDLRRRCPWINDVLDERVVRDVAGRPLKKTHHLAQNKRCDDIVYASVLGDYIISQNGVWWETTRCGHNSIDWRTLVKKYYPPGNAHGIDPVDVVKQTPPPPPKTSVNLGAGSAGQFRVWFHSDVKRQIDGHVSQVGWHFFIARCSESSYDACSGHWRTIYATPTAPPPFPHRPPSNGGSLYPPPGTPNTPVTATAVPQTLITAGPGVCAFYKIRAQNGAGYSKDDVTKLSGWSPIYSPTGSRRICARG